MPDDTRTGFDGIERLLPGHILHANRTLDVTQHPYWAPAGLFGTYKGNRHEAEDELWARLLDGVDRSLEGPTGILVSGGIDSAAVTAAAAVLGRPLSLVHVAFPGFADASEEPYAGAVADSANAELEVAVRQRGALDPEDDLEVSMIPYLSPPDYTANAGLAHLGERGLTVALDGNDGDGVLGYRGREWGELVATGKIASPAGALGDVRSSRLLRAAWRGTCSRRPFAAPYAAGRCMLHLSRADRAILRPAAPRADQVRRPRALASADRRVALASAPAGYAGHDCTYGGAPAARRPLRRRPSSSLRRPRPRRVPRVAAGRIKSDPMRSKALLRDALAGHAPHDVLERVEKPEYRSVFERRVDRGRCLDLVKESGIRLPFVNYETLYRDGAESSGAPLFLLLLLARAHVFAASH